ncbi:hypothetical protein LZ32DRAFT_610173, partial [Colletotrichum eremochloae]
MAVGRVCRGSAKRPLPCRFGKPVAVRVDHDDDVLLDDLLNGDWGPKTSKAQNHSPLPGKAQFRSAKKEKTGTRQQNKPTPARASEDAECCLLHSFARQMMACHLERRSCPSPHALWWDCCVLCCAVLCCADMLRSGSGSGSDAVRVRARVKVPTHLGTYLPRP